MKGYFFSNFEIEYAEDFFKKICFQVNNLTNMWFAFKSNATLLSKKKSNATQI